jgi:hypothetical protein
MQPLSLVENQHFSDLIRNNDPRLTLPCRGTITHTILNASQSGPTFSGPNFSGPKILAGVGPEW